MILSGASELSGGMSVVSVRHSTSTRTFPFVVEYTSSARASPLRSNTTSSVIPRRHYPPCWRLEVFVSSKGMDDFERLLEEQATYYRERAGEYDDWWLRQGIYDQGPEFFDWWNAEIAQLGDWLGDQAPLGSVLEIAAGTGNLTRMIKPHAQHIVAIDTSPETLAINKAKNGASKVDYVVADALAWDSAERFDTVAFGFWLSHVPESKFDSFFERVGGWLHPGGRVLFIDNRPYDSDWPVKPNPQNDTLHDPDQGTSQRFLRDGRTFQIIKIFREPEELASRLDKVGWHADVNRTTGAFIYGTATQHQSASKT